MMDAKITLAFDEQVIKEAKAFAKRNNVSLSRLTEMIFRQMTAENHQTIDDLPISDWVKACLLYTSSADCWPARRSGWC